MATQLNGMHTFHISIFQLIQTIDNGICLFSVQRMYHRTNQEMNINIQVNISYSDPRGSAQRKFLSLSLFPIIILIYQRLVRSFIILSSELNWIKFQLCRAVGFVCIGLYFLIIIIIIIMRWMNKIDIHVSVSMELKICEILLVCTGNGIPFSRMKWFSWKFELGAHTQFDTPTLSNVALYRFAVVCALGEHNVG